MIKKTAKISFLKRLRYAPWFSQLVIVRRCNLSCSYCNEFDQTSSPVDLSVLKARLDKLKVLGTYAINLTGGEPTLHPDLPELIRYCRHELKFFKTTMISNGFLLKEELIHQLNEAGLQDMQISIDGVEPNRSTVKVLKSLEQKLVSLKQHAKFNVVVSAVVGSCPPEESFRVIQRAKELGFKPRVLLIHDHSGQVQLSEEQLKVFYQIKKMIPKSFPEFTDYRETMIAEGKAPFKCRGGSRYLYVDENGLVSWCSQTRQVFAKDLMDYQYEDLRREFYSYKSCQDQCTLGCVRAASSVDGWRKQELPQLNEELANPNN
ncbi:MAG: radical SAM protein [Deltaproteobacteria bacterium]|nr:radical SAM protein [Deltaproteobacteria bacterium]